MKEPVAIQPDTEFLKRLVENGGGDLKKCYQCATCSVVCDMAGDELAFPRRQMIAAQWGLKDRLMEDPAPWLCFYCGECSKRCPREANPGESMMAIRRYLTTAYDWTGLSRLMYGSALWEIGVLALVSALVVLAFVLPSGFGFGLLSRHPEALNAVMLDHFAPKDVVHTADRILAGVLSLLLLSNALRMFRYLTRNRQIPLGRYITLLPELVMEGVFQRRWRKCADTAARFNWARHFVLVTGYVTIFSLVVLFLPTFQVEDNTFHWTSLLGYYSTAVLVGSSISILADRKTKRSPMHRFSHLSDWLFPILLLLTAVTGILLNVVRLANLAMPTYIIYTVHLAIAVPMLVVEVPFGKWAHLLYRPLAIYVAAAISESDGSH